jgi:hypothetical protein
LKTRTCFILALLLFASVLAAAQAKPATLKSISFQKTETELVAQIEFEGEFTYQTFEMADPGRLVVEFKPVTKVMTEASYDVNAFGVTAVRTAQFQPEVARIVFDVPGTFPLYKIAQNQNQVVVTLSQTQAAAAEPVAEPVAAPAAAAQAVADLKGITFESVNNQIKVKILTEGAAAFQSSRLAQPSRLLLLFAPVERISAPPFMDINRSGLKRITIEKTEGQGYQVVFALDENQPSFNITTAPNAVEILFWQDATARPAPAAKPAARPAVEEPSAARPFPNTQFGILAGNYGIASRSFSDIYGSSSWLFGAELSRTVFTTKKVSFGLGFAYRSFSKDGLSTYTKDKTTLTLQPLSLTATALLTGRDVIPFLGIGVDRFGYKEKSDIHEVSGNTIGFHLHCGLYYRIPGLNILAAKVYAKFTQATATQDSVDIKLGGTEFGLSLNLCFDLPKR